MEAALLISTLETVQDRAEQTRAVIENFEYALGTVMGLYSMRLLLPIAVGMINGLNVGLNNMVRVRNERVIACMRELPMLRATLSLLGPSFDSPSPSACLPLYYSVSDPTHRIPHRTTETLAAAFCRSWTRGRGLLCSGTPYLRRLPLGRLPSRGRLLFPRPCCVLPRPRHWYAPFLCREFNVGPADQR
jgi:hypothetical protein